MTCRLQNMLCGLVSVVLSLQTSLLLMEVITESVITCPFCGHSKNEKMPENACVYFYKCESCKTILKPLPGDCCVFCSFGTIKCPPRQKDESCC